MAFQHFSQAQSTFAIPLIANDNAYLGDVVSSESRDPHKPISGGLFRLTKGEKLVYTYTYDEVKIVLEGDYTVSDETGQTTEARPGDVLYFPKGATITFTTTDYGLAFYAGQRAKNAF